MYTNAQKGDLIKSLYTGEVCNVVEVNDYWGWFRVRNTDGKSKVYRTNNGNGTFVRMTPEEIGNLYLNGHWSKE